MILRRDDDAGDHAARHRGRVVQHAVDAVADAHLLALGLEVDVGGALLDALGDHAVDELDDRRLAGGLADLGDLAAALGLLLAPPRSPRRSRRRACSALAIAATMSSADATTGRTSRPVMIEMSSTARTLVGSDIATIKRVVAR